MPYCRNCGTQLAEDAQYCYNCGTSVTIPTSTSPPSLPPTVVSVIQQSNMQKKASSKPVYKDSLFILMLFTLIITIIALVIAATSLAHLDIGINGQNFFEHPGINRVNLNIQKITNYILH